jgi:predicted transcriptional regulator
MIPSHEFSPQPNITRAVLLSVKPQYAELIASALKRVEFRRAWATENVGVIVIYASSPVQRIVAMANIQEVVHAAPTTLWSYCSTYGGGLTRQELRDYFYGKNRGYAVLLKSVRKLKIPVDPKILFDNFIAPQSFRYLTSSEMAKLVSKVAISIDDI